jgi:hypothetical protein
MHIIDDVLQQARGRRGVTMMEPVTIPGRPLLFWLGLGLSWMNGLVRHRGDDWTDRDASASQDHTVASRGTEHCPHPWELELPRAG